MGAVQNIRAAYEARNVLIENRGALGILTNNSTDGIGSTLPLDESEKKKVQDEWKKYGIQKNQFQAIITSLNLKWQQISTDANKLQLFEETKADQEQICDAYGVPFELFANQKGVTFDNKKQARREFYENTIIPEAEEWIDALNRYFETYNKSWEIKGSFDHLSVFQENQKERAQSITLLTNALSKAFADGALTLEEYKSELRKLRIGENG
jgi:HK97 family phage portal protein